LLSAVQFQADVPTFRPLEESRYTAHGVGELTLFTFGSPLPMIREEVPSFEIIEDWNCIVSCFYCERI
jgi:hypothetical protein